MNGLDNFVPILNVPSDVRIHSLRDYFIGEFENEPDFYARVPGRVNIIGEHIDYCGYPVLPMALEQDIIVSARSINEHKIYIRNKNCFYTRKDLEIKPFEEIEIEGDKDGNPYWYNYVLCGIKGALEYLDNEVSYGVQLCIDGNIPPASGLSSSSALVSAACLAFLYAQNATLNKKDIASLCARCERYIGTQGGGMDQAIAFLAEKNCAQYITWNPLTATKVLLPENASFVVAHSLSELNKAATNDYNRRVTECRLAAKVLALSTSSTNDHSIITLSQVQKLLNKSLKTMTDLVYEKLPKEIYFKNEICAILNISEDEINEYYLTQNTRHIKEFKLKQRALHVYGEALRVDTFREICANSCSKMECNGVPNGSLNKSVNNNDILNKLGELISSSHESLKTLYECSHENLDTLVEISKQMNIHSRLTGAGWGGCIVALCPNDRVREYINMLEKEFYEKHCNIENASAKSYIFATSPNNGAVIYANKFKN